MKRVLIVPNVITAFGLTCGLFVIFKTSVAPVGNDLFTILQAAAILILIAAIADLADGAVARIIKAQSEFGGQFDSLADAVTFGVAPPLLALKSITGAGESPGALLTFFAIIAAMIYTLCGVLRLVRFNVQSQSVKKERLAGVESSSATRHFVGLPIPAAASAAVSASLIFLSPFFLETLGWVLPVKVRAIVLTLTLVGLGYFMISRWRFPSLKALHFRIPSFYLVLTIGFVAVLFLYGILDYFALAYFVVSWLYLVLALACSMIRLSMRRRSSRFEPDED